MEQIAFQTSHWPKQTWKIITIISSKIRCTKSFAPPISHTLTISYYNHQNLTGEAITIHKTSFAENMIVTKSLALTTNHGDVPLQVRRSWRKVTEPWVRCGTLIKIKIRVQRIVLWYVFEWIFWMFVFCSEENWFCSRFVSWSNLISSNSFHQISLCVFFLENQQSIRSPYQQKATQGIRPLPWKTWRILLQIRISYHLQVRTKVRHIIRHLRPTCRSECILLVCTKTKVATNR